MDCVICCFAFNGASRKPIDCPKCDSKTCVTCVRKYLDSSLEDPHCMHCKHQWDLFFVNKVLPRTYMSSGWKASRSSLLLNRERSFFPDTMVLVAREIEKENIMKEIKALEEKEKALKQKKHRLQARFYRVDHPEAPAEAAALEADPENSFRIRQCPTANCKGFLDRTNGLCVICNKTSCLRCNVNKEAEAEGVHECKQEDLDTWQLITGSSKPCPNCATRIQKSEGCAQMWCPGCHVAFNWQTGKVERGAIHNPHYYEWAARVGVQNAAPQYRVNPCDAGRIWHFYYYPVEVRSNIEFRELHQKLNHTLHNDLDKLREKIRNDNTDLRISFLRDRITEDNYKKSLIKREIQRQKDVRMVDALETIRQVVTPMLQQVINKEITPAALKTQVKSLERFLNDSIDEINGTFKSNIGFITF